ncbi:receptor activity-modifying protein 3 [Cricetulus griseus]|uniref:Receptor activity-modifying protein 3 n=1 Tax=Cricetulus griseus TaxID=10029 RepID=A0A061IM72_CRIGR|nr:receptor activity-modifying protein 3 [Cricetulus griseus]
MLERLPRCGKAFADMMQKVDVWKWCNLSEFIVYYESFTNCTEVETNIMGCYWPNPLAQSFITGIHRQFFSNCTVDRAHWEDPPDEVLIPLIAVPVVLTVAMAGLVVWRSKRTDQLLGPAVGFGEERPWPDMTSQVLVTKRSCYTRCSGDWYLNCNNFARETLSFWSKADILGKPFPEAGL